MKISHTYVGKSLCLILSLLSAMLFSCNVTEPAKIKALVVTGGHEFDRANFFNMFDSFSNIEYNEVKHPEANKIYLSDTTEKYDVIIFYDLYQDITESQKIAFTRILKKGMGLLFLHHCLGSYQEWDEFFKVIGGRYYLQPTINSKNLLVSSTFKHNIDITIQTAGNKHPITKGVTEFKIHGEGYNNIDILPSVDPILFNLHAECEKLAGWTNNYENSRIVYIQPGHDNNAYSNTNYRKLVNQAINWAANK